MKLISEDVLLTRNVPINELWQEKVFFPMLRCFHVVKINCPSVVMNEGKRWRSEGVSDAAEVGGENLKP